MKNIEKVAVELTTNKKYLLKTITDDFITPQGMLNKRDLKQDGRIRASTGKVFSIIKPSFVDLWENLKRGPQIMVQKDIGLIIAKTGINKDSIVVDAGAGTGSLCLSLANICKHITTYETNGEHAAIVERNIQMVGFNNIVLKKENINNGIVETDVDLITLDLPEPWKVLEHAEKALVMGGFLVIYLPNILQVKTFVDTIPKSGISLLEVVELMERQWRVEENIVRPEFEMLGHTGFLVFCRKI
ncbi:tRNA (adenine-N1)-methyltransferase [Candidatus Woesearchaeota archaeon]|nr:tRNA (adenine-N1)-methyltransferase [Candidatus Woesearchaeota archaeon]